MGPKVKPFFFKISANYYRNRLMKKLKKKDSEVWIVPAENLFGKYYVCWY